MLCVSPIMYLDRVVSLLWAGRASESHSRFPAVMSCSGWWSRLWAQVKRSPRHRHTAREGRGSSSRAAWLTAARGLSFARCEVPAGMITTPAKHSHHVVGESLPAAGRPLRPGERSSVCSNVVRSTHSAYGRVSLVACSAACGIRPR